MGGIWADSRDRVAFECLLEVELAGRRSPEWSSRLFPKRGVIKKSKAKAKFSVARIHENRKDHHARHYRVCDQCRRKRRRRSGRYLHYRDDLCPDVLDTAPDLQVRQGLRAGQRVDGSSFDALDWKRR